MSNSSITDSHLGGARAGGSPARPAQQRAASAEIGCRHSSILDASDSLFSDLKILCYLIMGFLGDQRLDDFSFHLKDYLQP